MKLNQKAKRYLEYAKYALLALAYLFLMEVLGWIFSSQGTWSLSLVLYRTKGKGIVPALHFLNGAGCALYPYLYFERMNVFSALNLCVLLFLFSFYLFRRTLEVERPAAYLLLPYIIWLGVALILSYQSVLLN